MTDSVDPAELGYLDAIRGPEGPSQELSPAERYIREQRGESVEPQKAQETPQESPSKPARDAATGRFTKAEEAEEAPQELTSAAAVDYLMGTTPTVEELEERERAHAEEELRSGEAVKRIANEARITTEMLDRLKTEHEGIDSPEAIAAMQPTFDRVAEEYGIEVASSPITLGQIFSEVNSDGRFSPDPQAEAWSERSLGIEPSRSAFTR